MKRLYFISLLFGLHLWVPLACAQVSPLAFPTAEGFGKFAQGGRGGRVIEVSTLKCTGPGSFLEALQAAGPRTIVFKVGGIIDCSTHYGSFYLKNPYLTVAGQTAPGDGILVKGLSLAINTNDVIFRYMQSRLGEDINMLPDSAVSLMASTGAKNVIIDHTSLTWAPDDTAGAFEADNVTYQWNIIGEALNCVKQEHGDGYCQGKGFIQGFKSPIKTSIHHNLFVNNSDRNPGIGTGTVDVINNVTSNVGGNDVLVVPYYSPVRANIVGNYFSPGPISLPKPPVRLIGSGVAKAAPQSLAYIRGNIDPDFRPDNSKPELDVVMFVDGPIPIPTTTARIATMFYPSETDAFQAYKDVLADAGDNKRLNEDGTFSPRRGPVDTRIINEVKTKTGTFIRTSVNEVGGFPVLQNGTPYLDTDKDGMSDLWENKYGFNKADPTDGSKDSNGDGYTNLEEFLNGTYPLLKNILVKDTTSPASPEGIKILDHD